MRSPKVGSNQTEYISDEGYAWSGLDRNLLYTEVACYPAAPLTGSVTSASNPEDKRYEEGSCVGYGHLDRILDKGHGTGSSPVSGYGQRSSPVNG